MLLRINIVPRHRFLAFLTGNYLLGTANLQVLVKPLYRFKLSIARFTVPQCRTLFLLMPLQLKKRKLPYIIMLILRVIKVNSLGIFARVIENQLIKYHFNVIKLDFRSLHLALVYTLVWFANWVLQNARFTVYSGAVSALVCQEAQPFTPRALKWLLEKRYTRLLYRIWNVIFCKSKVLMGVDVLLLLGI